MSFFELGDDEHIVQSRMVVINVQELIDKDPEMKRLFDIINQSAEEVGNIVQIAVSNIKTILEQAILEKDEQKAGFVLGAFGQLSAALNHFQQSLDAEVQETLPRLIEEGCIDLNGPSDELPAQEPSVWDFGG